MKFEYADSYEAAAGPIAERFAAALDGGNSVLWLQAGGSAIHVAVTVNRLLLDRDIDLSRLTFGLTDERYGEVGHPDSNWQQLIEAGLNLPGATLHPTLVDGLSRDETTLHQAAWLETALRDHDYKLALFGIGPDAHIAGILPGSSAATESRYAAGYTAAPFERVTMTFPAIEHLDEAVVYMAGANKLPVIEDLAAGHAVRTEQPDQVLHDLRAVVVYTDQQVVTENAQ